MVEDGKSILIKSWKKILIKDLKPHALNQIFDYLPEKTYEALKEDIKKRGLKIPIDITENKTIVCGCQRVKILNELGIKELKENQYRILKDLTEDQIKEHLIKDNILRRQLTPAQIVEAGKELEKIYKKQDYSYQ